MEIEKLKGVSGSQYDEVLSKNLDKPSLKVYRTLKKHVSESLKESGISHDDVTVSILAARAFFLLRSTGIGSRLITQKSGQKISEVTERNIYQLFAKRAVVSELTESKIPITDSARQKKMKIIEEQSKKVIILKNAVFAKVYPSSVVSSTSTTTKEKTSKKGHKETAVEKTKDNVNIEKLLANEKDLAEFLENKTKGAALKKLRAAKNFEAISAKLANNTYWKNIKDDRKLTKEQAQEIAALIKEEAISDEIAASSPVGSPVLPIPEPDEGIDSTLKAYGFTDSQRAQFFSSNEWKELVELEELTEDNIEKIMNKWVLADPEKRFPPLSLPPAPPAVAVKAQAPLPPPAAATKAQAPSQTRQGFEVAKTDDQDFNTFMEELSKHYPKDDCQQAKNALLNPNQTIAQMKDEIADLLTKPETTKTRLDVCILKWKVRLAEIKQSGRQISSDEQAALESYFKHVDLGWIHKNQ